MVIKGSLLIWEVRFSPGKILTWHEEEPKPELPVDEHCQQATVSPLRLLLYAKLAGCLWRWETLPYVQVSRTAKILPRFSFPYTRATAYWLTAEGWSNQTGFSTSVSVVSSPYLPHPLPPHCPSSWTDRTQSRVAWKTKHTSQAGRALFPLCGSGWVQYVWKCSHTV